MEHFVPEPVLPGDLSHALIAVETQPKVCATLYQLPASCVGVNWPSRTIYQIDMNMFIVFCVQLKSALRPAEWKG
jgi:hypothetical protein